MIIIMIVIVDVAEIVLFQTGVDFLILIIEKI